MRAIGGIYLLRGIRAGPEPGIKSGDGIRGWDGAHGENLRRGNRRLYDPGVTQHINENNARESIERTYKLIHDFNCEFTALHGSLNCKDLIKLDLSIPEQRAEAQDKHIFVTVCPDIVRDAAKIMESLLATC